MPPSHVGIRRVSVYVPSAYVAHADLEERDGCTPKYTQGLEQEGMAVWNASQEDAVSMALTATRSLLAHVDPCAIGCLRVGTETLPDKSKSAKTVLMSLLAEHGNTHVEGVSHVNACYGGTDALFAAVAWIQSESWDGRLALVVCTDTAVYDPESAAYATGGAGCVALLVGPDAPLVLEPRRVTVSEHVHDFYKPEFEHYPRVHGKLSQDCYLRALDTCLARYTPHDVDHWLFHAPYVKLVRKAHARVYAKQPRGDETNAALLDFERRVARGLDVCRRVGNLYTASLYGCLASYLPHVQPGERLAAFSYGAGYVASLFVLQARGRVPVTCGANDDLPASLDARRRVPPEVYDAAMAGVDPTVDPPPHVYRVTVDEWQRRHYNNDRLPDETTTTASPSGSAATMEDGEDALVLVDEWDTPVGRCGKRDAHLGQGKRHRAFSLFLFHEGRLLLQQRSKDKPLFPHAWANTCCSHPRDCPWERETRDFLGVKRAAVRRAAFELGVQSLRIQDLVHVGRLHYRAGYGGYDLTEHEIDHLLFARVKDVHSLLTLNPDEVAAVQWVTPEELRAMDPDTLSPWLRALCESDVLYAKWRALEADTLTADPHIVHLVA